MINASDDDASDANRQRPTPTQTSRLLPVVALCALVLMAAFLWWAADQYRQWRAQADPVTVAAASLEGLREQNILVPFTARYVAVVTSTETRLGLAAQKTLIMPGTVRYELDLGALDEGDLSWDADAKRLSVTLPPLRLAGPEIDIASVREYRDGTLLMLLTDAERRIDDANRDAARRELLAQAHGAVPMRLARQAAARAIEQSFALPLAAAGINARVVARFDTP